MIAQLPTATQHNIGDVVYVHVYGRVRRAEIDYIDIDGFTVKTRDHHGYTVYPMVKRIYMSRAEAAEAGQ